VDKKDKPAGAGFWGTPELLNRYSNDTPGQSKKVKLKKEDRDMKSAKEFLNDIIEEIVNEDLLNEENKPTDPTKWAASISAAKTKLTHGHRSTTRLLVVNGNQPMKKSISMKR
jgi:hypothetical protein